jgi:hypothetical protein
MRQWAALLLLLITSSAYGQEIQFLKTSHDFGKINENINYARCTFTFVNIGKKPILISSVQTSCGCTTPDWTRDSIMPGDSGYVEAKYETINRIGSFRKTVSVYTNALNSPFVHLDIFGDVFREEVANNDMQIPDYGKIYFDEQTISLEVLYDNAPDTMTVRLINGTIFTTNFEPLSGLPEYCTILGMPKSLEPNETVRLTVILDGRKLKKYGFNAFQIPFIHDNPMNQGLGLFVTYKLKQYFPKMGAKELKKAPKISWDKEVHDFGEAETGSIHNTVYTVTNQGKSDLVLHEIYPECSCLTVKFDKSVLKPGESMKVQVTYDTKSKKGQASQSIWIVSNDPTKPEMYLYVKAKMPEKVYHCPTCH